MSLSTVYSENDLKQALYVAAQQKVGPDLDKQEIQIEWWVKIAKIRSTSSSEQRR